MTYDEYEQKKELDDLKEKGALTEEEYQKEKEKLFTEESSNAEATAPVVSDKKPLFGLEESTYITLMHLSQFAGFIIPGLGFIAPIVMWVLGKEGNENVDKHGKNIMNFMISYLIYSVVAGVLVLVLIGILLLIVLGVLMFVFIIVAAVKASNKQYWKYPLTIDFIK